MMADPLADLEQRSMADGPQDHGRREFLRLGAAGVLLGGGLLTAGAGKAAADRSQREPGGAGAPKVRNVIFMISDGMSIGTLTLADMFMRQEHKRLSEWVQLWSRTGVQRALCATFAANALVTDSAAAATAYSIGQLVNNGAICTTPDGREPVPILVRARQRGLATGLVTTTRLTHATPAAFIANARSRNHEPLIAAQMLSRGVDVALGGGAVHFPQQALDGHADLAIVRTRDELLGLRETIGRRILGLFTDDHMSYEIERPDYEPSLAEMTRAALKLLDNRDPGFLVQIEGGRVDHAAHNNDVASLIHDQLAFDEALGAAYQFASARDDTLLIVTTDHGNANPGLTIYGEEGNRRFERIAGARHSFPWIRRQMRENERRGDHESLPAVIKEATGITLTETEETMLARLRAGEAVHPFATANSLYPVLGAIMANHFGVAFVSPNHTSDFVEVAAFGPGSDQLRPMINNTDLHTLVSGVLDLPPAHVA